MISMIYASYETELCDDNHIYEWETWSSVLEDGLFKLTWRMIEKAPDDGVYRTDWELDRENTDRLLSCLAEDRTAMIQPGSRWGERFLQMENLADNVMEAVYEHFHGRGCKESFLQYCREHDIAYREVWR